MAKKTPGFLNNVNRMRKLYFLNIIGLCVLCLLLLAGGIFTFARLQETRSELSDLQEALLVAPTDAAKVYYTQDDVEYLESQAGEAGAESREREIKTQIQSSLESGESTLTMLRRMFEGDLVISSGGRYYFYPVRPSLSENSWQEGDFALDGAGRLRYDGTDTSARIRSGVVCSENGEIDWEKVSRNGISFAMLRALDEEEPAAAAEAGLEVGIYYELSAETVTEAARQAQDAAKLVPKHSVVAVCAGLPAEDGRVSGSRKKQTDLVIAACRRLSGAGYQPVICSDLAGFTLYLEQDRLEDWPKWIIEYGDDPYFPYQFDLWTYSGTGRVDGIEGPVQLCAVVTDLFSR